MRTRGARAARLALATFATAVALAGMLAATAEAGPHRDGHVYAEWSEGSGIWNVDQTISLHTAARSTFWAMQTRFTGRSYGITVGLQSLGRRVGGRTADLVSISGYRANAASGTCESLPDARRCTIPYKVRTGREYRLRLWRLGSDAGGQWWGAWIKDLSTGVETKIGEVRAPVGDSEINHVSNYSEYFGGSVACDQVPYSHAEWRAPRINNGAFVPVGDGGSVGACSSGAQVGIIYLADWTHGTRLYLGGRTPKNTRVVLIHGFEHSGINNCESTWRDLLNSFYDVGWSSNKLSVASYYAGDRPCTNYPGDDNVAIGSHGSHSTHHPSGHVEAGGTVIGHSTDARIPHLAYHWAWTIHERYTRHGIPIDAVGHSMGGLIMRAAIAEVQRGNPVFPPRLLVEDVVTLGTPHTGADFANVCALTHGQCRDLRPDSDFLNDLSANAQNPQGDGGTEWSTFAAEDDDTTSRESGLGMSAVDEVSWHSGTGIEHGEYMHKKTGADLNAFDAPLDIWHYGARCADTRGYWPVRMTSIALEEVVQEC